MTNRLIELVIALIVIVVAVWVLSLLLPMLNLPAPLGTILLVVIAAVAVIWMLRWLQRSGGV